MFAFGAPAVGAGYMYLLLSLYVMKFCTDVLLIAPAIMGIIYSLSRFWDAISDPVAGYCSDRTRLRFGRRRSWILASLIPICLTFTMVFGPPASLEGTQLIFWMAIAIIGFYSAMTVFYVPHLSLGAELSDDYHERSRLFGMRHAFYTTGSMLSLATMYLLISAEARSEAAVRQVAFDQALIACLAMGLLIVYAVVRLREPRSNARKIESGPFQAFKDVGRNPYARRLYLVWFIENIGGGAIAALTLYVCDYVVGAPQWAPGIILCYMAPSTFAVPIWVATSRRFGKVNTWISSMCLTGVSFGGMFVLPFLDSPDVRLLVVALLAFSAGFASAGGGSLGPSVQSDVIDYDELHSHERKEGSYFAVWNFVYKSGLGVMLMLTGFVLEFAGFEPNVEQSMTVKLAMVSLYGLVPLTCYLLGALLFRGFALDESAHEKIKAELDARKTQ
ncbi:MAG: MFS transporter [Pseudomonadales bacterium]